LNPDRDPAKAQGIQAEFWIHLNLIIQPGLRPGLEARRRIRLV
jgi:hypothetical protein